MKVRVNPVFDGFYYSSYLLGLEEVFGPNALRYSCAGFPEIRRHRLEQGYDLAFIVPETGLRVFIDQQDNPPLYEPGLFWCDVYAKINLDPALVPSEYAAKLLAIGPTFPVKHLGPLEMWWHAVRNYLLARGRISLVKQHFARWRAQWKYRLPHSAYVPGTSEPDYVFFSATLWKQEAARCNEFRAYFIDACRAVPGLRFEGGFCQRWQVPGFEKYSVSHRPTHQEYVAKTQRSTFVFNTPAVAGCHGWKLAEFLAMGKAILSLPPLRALPAPLVHGENIHYVEPTIEAIGEAVSLLSRDQAYRRKLEQGARAYYLQWLQPKRVIERILSAGQERTRPVLHSIAVAETAPAGVGATAADERSARLLSHSVG